MGSKVSRPNEVRQAGTALQQASRSGAVPVRQFGTKSQRGFGRLRRQWLEYVRRVGPDSSLNPTQIPVQSQVPQSGGRPQMQKEGIRRDPRPFNSPPETLPRPPATRNTIGATEMVREARQAELEKIYQENKAGRRQGERKREPAIPLDQDEYCLTLSPLAHSSSYFQQSESRA